MLLSSFRSFQSIIMPDRTVPLTVEQTDEVCRDLNSIYINILGVLDNYAWVMVHQFGNEETKKARPTSVGLFKSTLAGDCNLKTCYRRGVIFSWLGKRHQGPARSGSPSNALVRSTSRIHARGDC
jgi:hypothetical protein